MRNATRGWEPAHHAVAVPLRERLDDPADHVDAPTRLDRPDAALERLAGALDQQPRLLVDVAGEEGRVGVAVHAVEERGDVDVDDVAGLDDPAVGDAVADHLVDARAQRLREAAVAQRRGVGAVVAEELVADPVELVGGDAGHDVATDLLAGLRGEPARDAHPLDGLGVLDLGAGVGRRRLAVDVLGAHDVGGHGSARRQGRRGHGSHADRV